jgi:hypothetical protein
LDICPLLITQLFDSAYKVLNHLQIDGPKLKLFISLLNTDLKIASAVLANRLKQVLSFIIRDTQKGFMKNRFMGENTRLLYDPSVFTSLRDTCNNSLILKLRQIT